MPTPVTSDPPVKKLEEVLGNSAINFADVVPADCDAVSRKADEYGNYVGSGCSSISFAGFGKDYFADQLIGYGFDSNCNTCDAHYSIIFMASDELPAVKYMNSGYDYILMLPLDNSMFSNGAQLCQYIMQEVNDPNKGLFTDHYQQYAIKGDTIYIFDNRPWYDQLGAFYTYVFKICIKIECEYVGPNPIRIGFDYDPNDVIVYGTWHDGTVTVLPSKLYQLSSLTVTQPGPNEFTVTYIRNWDLKDTFTINGRSILAIKAEYNGPEVLVRDEYNPQYVTVTALLVGGSTEPIQYTDCIFPDRLIIDNKYNRKECFYHDEDGTQFGCEFIVLGIPRPIELIPKYIGPVKILDDWVAKPEFKCQVKYLLNIFEEDCLQTEIVDIEQDDWEFAGDTIITEANDGWISLSFTKDFDYTEVVLYAQCYVPYITLSATLKAWYEGPSIEVGEQYVLPNVVIYICQPGKDRIRLLYNDAGVIMDRDTVVRQKGPNYYTVQYINQRINIRTQYIVPGIVSKEFPDHGFKVLYIVKGTFEEIDLTNDFRPYFTFQDNFVITWQQFLNRLIDYAKDGTPYFGMFRVVAPKRTGLYNKYASEWHVYCFDDFNLKAEIYKIYSDEIKEDDDNGTTQEESSSGGEQSDGSIERGDAGNDGPTDAGSATSGSTKA